MAIGNIDPVLGNSIFPLNRFAEDSIVLNIMSSQQTKTPGDYLCPTGYK